MMASEGLDDGDEGEIYDLKNSAFDGSTGHQSIYDDLDIIDDFMETSRQRASPELQEYLGNSGSKWDPWWLPSTESSLKSKFLLAMTRQHNEFIWSARRASPRYARLASSLDEMLELYRIGSQAIRRVVCQRKMPISSVGGWAFLVVVNAMREAGCETTRMADLLFSNEEDFMDSIGPWYSYYASATERQFFAELAEETWQWVPGRVERKSILNTVGPDYEDFIQELNLVLDDLIPAVAQSIRNDKARRSELDGVLDHRPYTTQGSPFNPHIPPRPPENGLLGELVTVSEGVESIVILAAGCVLTALIVFLLYEKWGDYALDQVALQYFGSMAAGNGWYTLQATVVCFRVYQWLSSSGPTAPDNAQLQTDTTQRWQHCDNADVLRPPALSDTISTGCHSPNANMNAQASLPRLAEQTPTQSFLPSSSTAAVANTTHSTWMSNAGPSFYHSDAVSEPVLYTPTSSAETNAATSDLRSDTATLSTPSTNANGAYTLHCPACRRAITSNNSLSEATSNLKRHMARSCKMAHNKKGFFCNKPWCRKKFTRSDNLRQHVRNDH